MQIEKYILIINAGSATLKFKLYNSNLQEEVLGIVERIGLNRSFFSFQVRKQGSGFQNFPESIKDHEQAMRLVLEKLKKGGYKISAIGHRVVHGGEEFTEPIIINEQVLQKLEKYNQLAPLHNPHNLTCLKICRRWLPQVKNVAVFDTAFYKTIPDYIYLYALPLEFYQKHHIRRYGFHGISHQYAAQEAALKLKKKLEQINLITCHLGSGNSITAIKKGKALDTTMGFTPLEGLTMSTRAGDLDAMVPLYLMKELNMDIKKVIELLNEKSGWLGIAGIKDMREVLLAAGYKVKDFKIKKEYSSKEKKLAKLALQMFVYDVQRYLNSYLGLLGKTEAIVFTGGIGERSPVVKQLIMKGIKWPGRIKTLVVPANEELLIARETVKLTNNP